MKVASMVIVIFVLTLVIRLWIVGPMEEEGLEAPMSQLDVGHVIKSDMLLPPVTLWDATHVVGLVTKPKSVQVKEVNQGRVLPTHQQEEPVNLGRPMQEYLKIRRQRPTIRDSLRHGYMKYIKEVLEVPTTQSGVGNAIMLVTLLHLVVRWGVIVLMDLDTNNKIVGVHINNSWEGSHIDQQGKTMKMKERMMKGQMTRSKYGWRRLNNYQ